MTRICSSCSELRPLDVFVRGECEGCSGVEHPACDCPERVTIRERSPAVSERDIRAYHLFGKPERDRTAEELEWLEEYRGVAAPSLPEYVDGVHVGTVGKREDLTLFVEGVVALGPGDFGERYLARMRCTETGATVVWFTGENLNLYDEKTYRVRATIKNHEVYRGRRQTVVARVTVVEEVTDAK